MFYRALTLSIVAFWAVMMVQLVRIETHPETTDILNVPVSFVIGVMFRYAPLSLLNIRDGSKQIGSLEIRPSTTVPNGRTLNISGSLQLPGQDPFNFDGAMKMDTTSRLQSFRLAVANRRQNYHVLITGDMAQRALHYETRMGDQLIASESLPMEPAALERTLAQDLGLDPRMIAMEAGGIAAPDITARETQLTLRSGELQVYEVIVTEGGAPLLDLYMTQLGQIVLAKTSFGYTLGAEDWE
jgi:hypothetical protein